MTTRLDHLGQDETTGNGHQLKTRAAKAARWALLDRWLTRSLTTVVFIVLARLLAPEEFGIVALALVVRHFLDSLIDQGFNEAIVQSPNLRSSFTNTAFWTAIATGSSLAIGLFLAAPFIAEGIFGCSGGTAPPGSLDLAPVLRR